MATYYEILDLEPSATVDDIKRSYRKLALKYHPDKQGGDSERFTKISEAYQILVDPLQRQTYDLSGRTAEHVDFAPPEELFQDFFECMLSSGFFGFNHEALLDLFDGPEAEIAIATISNMPQAHVVFQQVQNFAQGTRAQPLVAPIMEKVKSKVEKARRKVNPHRSKDIEITLRVCLDDVFNRKLKKVIIRRIAKQVNRDSSIEYVNEEKSLIVPLYDLHAVFKNQADELPDVDEAGDVIVHVVIKDHDVFKVFRRKHLLIEKRVSLYELHHRCCFYVQHLNGEVLKISTKSAIYDKILQKVSNEGLPLERNSIARGDLYVRFILDTEMTQANLSILKDHFPPVQNQKGFLPEPAENCTSKELEPVSPHGDCESCNTR